MMLVAEISTPLVLALSLTGSELACIAIAAAILAVAGALFVRELKSPIEAPQYRSWKQPCVPGEPNALWEEFPGETSVWGGWKQSYGEIYGREWREWYAKLSLEERLDYLARHPVPTDDWKDWLQIFER